MESVSANRVGQLPEEELKIFTFMITKNFVTLTLSTAATEWMLSESEDLGFLPDMIAFFKEVTVVACPDNL